MKNPGITTPRTNRRSALKITIIYLALGGIWIIISDKLLLQFVDSAPAIATYQSFKGILFVVVTAIILYLLINRSLSKVEKTASRLKENQERLNLALTASNQGLWDWDIKNDVIHFNVNWAELLGYQHQKMDMNSSAWEKFIHPDDVEKLRQHLSDHLNGNTETYEAEYRVKTSSGDWRWFQAHGKIVDYEVTENGNPKRMIGVHNDVTASKEASQALRESQRMLSTLMSNLPGMAYRCQNDSLWTMEFVSEGCFPLTGYSPDDLIQNKRIAYAHLIHEEDRQSVEETVSNAVSKGEPFEITYRIITADNQQKWMWERGRAVDIKDGKAAHLEGFISDITEQIKSREIQQETEEKYRSVVDNVREVIFQTDSEGRWTFLNSSWTDISGYTLEESLGQKFAEFIHPDNRQQSEHEFLALLQGKKRSCRREVKYVTKNDGSRWCEINARPRHDNSGNMIGTLGTIIDISKRKEAEIALKERNLQYESFIQNTLVGIWRLEFPKPIPVNLPPKEIAIRILTTGYFSECNDALAKMYGANSNTELMNQPLKKFVVDFETSQTRLATVIKNNFRTELIDNDEKDLQGNIHYFRNSYFGYIEDEKLLWMWGIQLDITEQKKLEAQYLQSQKMEAVGKLAGGIAHDFNNLMTIVTGYGELLLNQLDNPEQVKNGIHSIKRAGERAASLTRQLLAFSRKQIIQPKILNLNTIVKDISKILERVIGENIELQTVLDPELKNVKVDPGQIEQVIMNLAVNARDAMPHGGKLILKTRNVKIDDRNVKRHLNLNPGNYVVLSVNDTGIGMDDHMLEQIFEPFYTTKEKGKGTGLGLSTAYGIVKQSGGIIEVKSEPEKGTTFDIYFPQTMEKSDKLTGQTESPAVHEGTETIMLVEDETAVRDLISDILKPNGYHVISTHTVEEAMKLCNEYSGSIHLIITDVIMPQMNGPELVKKCLKKRENLKVLYLSGYTEEAVTKHRILAQNVGFLQKPFKNEEFLQKVRQVLDAE